MKIEIELHDLERLKLDLKRAEDERDKANEQLKQLHPETLKKDAARLGVQIAKNAIAGLCRSMGYDATAARNIEIHNHEYYVHWLGNHWFESDELKVHFGAVFTDKWRQIFLTLSAPETPQVFKS